MVHDEHGNSRNIPAGASTGERPEAAVVATPMGYGMGTSPSPQVPPGPHSTLAGYQHHPHYYPTVGTLREIRGKDDMEGDGDANERRYKRYKTH